MLKEIRFLAALTPAALAVGSLMMAGGCYLVVQPPRKLSAPTKVLVGTIFIGSLASALGWAIVADKMEGGKQ